MANGAEWYAVYVRCCRSCPSCTDTSSHPRSVDLGQLLGRDADARTVLKRTLSAELNEALESGGNEPAARAVGDREDVERHLGVRAIAGLASSPRGYSIPIFSTALGLVVRRAARDRGWGARPAFLLTRRYRSGARRCRRALRAR